MEETTSKSGMSTGMIIGIAVIVAIFFGGGAYAYVNNKAAKERKDLNAQITELQSQVSVAKTATTTTPSASTNTTTATNSTTDDTANWKSFKSTKFSFGYTLYYPPTFSVTEGLDGGLVVKSEDGYPLFDLFSVQQRQSDYVNLVKDSSNGIMSSVKQSSITIAGVTGVKLEGTFGKNAGIENDHSGVGGTSIIFTKNKYTFVFNAYDNGDRSQDFNKMIEKLSF